MDTAAEIISFSDLQAFFPCGGLGEAINPCPRFNTIYVTNQKAGCTSIKLMLNRAETGDNHLDSRNIHVESRLPKPSSLGWPRVREMLSGSAYRFTFVRHPVDRLLSAYNDKILIDRNFDFAGLVLQHLGLPQDRDVTLPLFIDYLELCDPLEMDRHWRPQHFNLMHGLVEYDFVGRVETLERDMRIVAKEAGLPIDDVLHRNIKQKSVTHEDVAPYLSRIEKLYARDFELYGY